MTVPIRLSRIQCIFCAPRLLRDEIINLAVPFHRQTRGRKSSAKQPKMIYVKLLKDIVGYGRQGGILLLISAESILLY